MKSENDNNPEFQKLRNQLSEKENLLREFAKQFNELEFTNTKRRAIFFRLNQMVESLESGTQTEGEGYIIKFNEVQIEAMTKLQKRYTKLSNTEAHVAVMLAKGLANKEIATLTDTTVRNIESKRFSMRKKMGLKREDDLLKKIREGIE